MKRLLLLILLYFAFFPVFSQNGESIIINDEGKVLVRNSGGDFIDLALFLVPIGTIQAFGGATAPEGWLVCDGRALSSSIYPSLYETIGTAFGDGSKIVTGKDIESGELIFADAAPGMDFNLPDFRGQFLRGADPNGLIDPAFKVDAADNDKRRNAQGEIVSSENAIGSYQTDAYQGHWHALGDIGWGGHQNIIVQDLVGSKGWGTAGWFGNNVQHSIKDDKNNGEPRTSQESRSPNIAVQFIIKY